MQEVLFKQTPALSFLTDSPTLNYALGGKGIMVGNLVVIQAPTGDGKTTMMMRLAINAAEQGQKVAYISLGEQDITELTIRFACMITENKYLGSYEELYKKEEMEMISKATTYEAFKNIDIFYDEHLKNATFDKIIEDGYKFIFIDYLGCLLGPDKDSQYQYLTDVASYLKNLATDKDICIITAMQTNRNLLTALREPNFDPLSIDETFMADSIGPARKATICISTFRKGDDRYLVLFKNRFNGEKVSEKISVDYKSYKWTEIMDTKLGF